MDTKTTSNLVNSSSFIKLNAVNYYQWQVSFETFLAQKGFIHHIQHSNYDDYLQATQIIPAQQARYNKLKEKIKSTKYETADKQDEAFEELDQRFHNDLSKWSETEAKEAKKWMDQEDQIRGYLRATIEEGYWTSVKNLKSCHQIWVQLKHETQQQEAGNQIALLAEFFHLKFVPNELITHFIARAQSIADRIADLGVNFLTPALICYRILVEVPPQYDAITQSCFQIPKDKLSIALIKSKYAIEDSRQEASKNNNKDKPKRQPAQEEAYATNVQERKCRNFSTCKKMLPVQFKPHQNHCPECVQKFKESKKKSNDNSEEPKKENLNIIHIL
jgi:hypothetical protein